MINTPIRDRLARIFMRAAVACYPKSRHAECRLYVDAFDPKLVASIFDNDLKPLWPES